MSETDDQAGGEVRGVSDEDILADQRSRYAGVICPVHGVPPTFERDEAGSLIEAFCCEALAQIFRELRQKEGA